MPKDITKTQLVGILNLTPDSFSENGEFSSADKALKQAHLMIKQGATIIDIGGESTRPDATIISPETEWQRIKQIIELLQPIRKKAKISIDTRNHQTAKKALELGVDWINDVSGLSSPQMIDVIKNSDCKIIIMHNLGVPADKSITISAADDPIKVVFDWAQQKIKEVTNAGIDKSRIIFDIGIGFGKTAEQSLALIQSIEIFKLLDVPLYIGHSRKSFLSLLAPEKKPEERDNETATISAFLAKHDINYLRVHNIKANQQAIKAIL